MAAHRTFHTAAIQEPRGSFKRLQHLKLMRLNYQLGYLVVVFDDFYNVAAVAAQSGVTAAFNVS